MTARSVPQVVSSRIRERQTCASTASMPNARPWRRGQAPKPHGGAPKAQGLTVAIAVAAPSPVPSFVPPVNLNSTGADVPINAFATARIYTSLTDVTHSWTPWPIPACSTSSPHCAGYVITSVSLAAILATWRSSVSPGVAERFPPLWPCRRQPACSTAPSCKADLTRAMPTCRRCRQRTALAMPSPC
jgi:hypothetical protein